MENINIYIADLEAYNSGRLVGEWVSLPVDEDELNEIVNRLTNDGMGDYAIHDYEAPQGVDISEYSSPWELNELAERIESLKDWQKEELEYILQAVNGGIEEALEVMESGDYRIYHDCYDMEDVAETVVDETGMLDSIPENLRYYFDYEKYGRDLEIEGDFTYCGQGVYVELIQ